MGSLTRVASALVKLRWQLCRVVASQAHTYVLCLWPPFPFALFKVASRVRLSLTFALLAFLGLA